MPSGFVHLVMLNCNHYIDIFKAMPTPGLLVLPNAPDFTIVQATDAFIKATGYAESDWAGKSLSEIYSYSNTENESGLQESLEIALRTRQPQKMAQQKCQFQTGNSQQLRDYFLTAENIPVLDHEGNVVAVIHLLTDISEKEENAESENNAEKQAILVLENRIKELNKILDSCPDVICKINEAGNFVKVNAAAEKMWGYLPEELIGQPYLNYVYPEDMEISRNAYNDIRSGVNVTNFVNRYVCKNGSLIPIVWSASWDDDEKMMYYAARNATEKKKAELEISLLMNNTEELFILLDKELRVVSLNEQFKVFFKSYFGRKIQRGDFIPDFFHSGRREILQDIYKKVLTGHQEISEFTLPDQYQSDRIFSIHYNPALDDRGEIIGVFLAVKDVTEARLAQKTIETSEEKYRLLFYKSPLSKWIYDLQSLEILEVNESAIARYGYSRDEFLTKLITDLFPEMRLQQPLKTMDDEEAGQTEIHVHGKKNGEIIKAEISYHQFSYLDKECVIVVANDVTQREDALQKLRENEARLLNAHKIAKLGYWQQTADGQNLYWSDEVYNIWEVSRDFFKVRYPSFLDTIHPDDHEIFNLELAKYWSGEKELDIEHRILLQDGTEKWVSETGRIIKDKDGHTVFFEGTVQDITAQKLLSLSLQESNQRYNYLARATSNAIWDWNLVTKTIFWGEGFQSIFGYNPNELKTDISSWTDHLHPDETEGVIDSIYKVINGTETKWTGEYRYLKKDQTYANVTDTGFVIRNEMGKAVRMVGSMQDTTKRKKEEYHLKLLESVITNTSDAVMITEAVPLHEPGPGIIYVNDAFTSMTGYKADEIVGKTPRILQGPKTDRKELDRLGEALKNGESCEITVINYKKNSEEFWINMSISPVADETGRINHFISIERDVTQRKNEELEKILFVEISQLFNEPVTLNVTLQKMLEKLVSFGGFGMAEAWLISKDRKKINQVASFTEIEMIKSFYEENEDLKSFVKGDGLTGKVWETQALQIWDARESKSNARGEAAKKAGLKMAYGLPFIYNQKVVGVIVFGLTKYEPDNKKFAGLFKSLGIYAGAEISRKQLEHDLNMIFNFAPDIICSVTNDGYFKNINPAMCHILGYTEEELTSIPIVDFIHPDDKWQIKAGIDNVNKDTATHYFENRYITRSGRIKWLFWTSARSPDQELIFTVAKDITDKKALEELLNKANTLARIGNWETDMQKGTVYWSEITRKIHEVDESYIPDFENGINFYPPGKNRETIIQKTGECFNNGTSWDVELQILTGKGNIRWIRTIGEAEFINGNCVRIYGSFQDINDRKVAELDFINTLEEKNTILESIDDAFFAVDKDWTVTYWNNQAEKNMGKRKEDMLGHNLWEIFMTSKDSDSYKYYHQAVDYNEVVRFEDYSHHTNKWYEVSAYPSDRGLSVYFKDITERKLSDIRLNVLNTSLQKQTRELATSNAELEQFAYVASHDLQEPLRMITGFLTQLEKKYSPVLDEKGKKYIYYAVDGAKRMRRIILDLLDFSRVGRSEDSRKDVALNELVNEIKILFSKQIEEKSAVIHATELPVINGFKTELRQVLHNLTSNALKYSEEGKPVEIHITARELPDYWQVAVADNGIGIDAEYYDKIFVIFQRLHNKDEYSGTGMGLAISKKIVENMGGKIWVESKEGKGSTFYFTIAKINE